MSLELVREAVSLNQPIGEDLIQTIVENDKLLPISCDWQLLFLYSIF
jgi:hypothetical protein